MDIQEIMDCAGRPGRRLEACFDRWIDSGECPQEEIDYWLDELEIEGKITSYCHFREIYDSIKQSPYVERKS